MLFHPHSVKFCSSLFQPQRFQADQVGLNRKKTKQQTNKQTDKQKNKKKAAQGELFEWHSLSIVL